MTFTRIHPTLRFKMALPAIVLAAFCLSCGNRNSVRVENLLCENDRNPIAVVEKKPLMSWQLSSAGRNVSQNSYRVLVSDDSMLLEKETGNCWDSKQVFTDRSIMVPYAGTPLNAGKAYYWKVMIWDNRGGASPWSSTACWRMGLSNAADWNGARWIGYEPLPGNAIQVPAVEGEDEKKWTGVKDVLPLLRKSFSVTKPVKSALAYVCGLGQFEFSLNGQKVGDHFLDPAWTKFDKEAQYIAFDVTGALKEGTNSAGVMLGNGFYFIPGERYRKISGAYGNPTLRFRLAITYSDGTTADVLSDSTWKTAPGPVTFSSIYGGEDYDARLEQPGWDNVGFDDSHWKQASPLSGPPAVVPQLADPLKYFDHFLPKKVIRLKPAVWVFDLGQNASGIPSLSLRGKKGQVIKIIPGELLDSSGMVSQQSSGSPVYFRYILKGQGTETWQPKFTYTGFRYLQVEGAVPDSTRDPAGTAILLSIESIHTRNAAAPAGTFSCSDSLFNKTFSLIDWAIRSNMASLFTDCPHREKLGWLEEVHLVGPSVRNNYNISRLLRKIVRDIKLAQTADGLIPDIAPEYVRFDFGFRNSPEWGSSAILLPWYAYQWYGDRRLLEESYEMMTRYANYLDSASTGHILDFGLGDWYDIGPKPPGDSQLTPKGLTATAIYYQDLTVMARVSALLGKARDSAIFTQRSMMVKQAFNEKFFDPVKNQYGSGSQTANAMACYLNLVAPENRNKVIEQLIAGIRAGNNSLTTGDIGYSYLLRALAEAGRSDVIFDMNSRSDVPGYGYQLARGATALTESWQAYPDESNNHFMFGELLEWFYGSLGGIKNADSAVAFHTVDISPEPVGTVTSASTTYDGPYGRITTRWTNEKKVFSLFVRIPPNTTANICFPHFARSALAESGKTVIESAGFHRAAVVNGRDIWRIGSGEYSFVLTHE